MQWNKNSVRDPVCGVYLDPTRAIERTVQGRTFYFCEEDCAERFLERASPIIQSDVRRVSQSSHSTSQARPVIVIPAGRVRERRTS